MLSVHLRLLRQSRLPSRLLSKEVLPTQRPLSIDRSPDRAAACATAESLRRSSSGERTHSSSSSSERRRCRLGIERDHQWTCRDICDSSWRRSSCRSRPVAVPGHAARASRLGRPCDDEVRAGAALGARRKFEQRNPHRRRADRCRNLDASPRRITTSFRTGRIHGPTRWMKQR